MPTKVCIVKAIVFPAVMYSCERWTIKKVDRQRTDAFKLWCSLDNKEIKPVNLKGNRPWIITERTDAEAEAPTLWPPDENSQLLGKDHDAVKDWRQKEKRVTKDEMAGWHHRCNGCEPGQTPGDGEGQGSLVFCKVDTTRWLNNNNEALKSYRLFSSHYRILLKISIKRYLKITNIFSSAMWHLPRDLWFSHWKPQSS